MSKDKRFEIGTVLTVEVQERRVVTYAFGKQFPSPVEHLLVACHERHEAFHLLNCGWNPEAKAGDTGTITLEQTEAGPAWRYQPHSRRQAQDAPKGNLLLPGRDF
jgi:hypothetical protein